MNSPDTSVQQALAVAKSYRRRSGLRSSSAIASNYIIFASCITIVQWAYSVPYIPATGAKALYLLSIIIIAARMRALENLVHEASHHNLFPSTPLHHKLQFLYAFPVFRTLQDYRRSHMVHHKHLGDLQKDPDIVRMMVLGLDGLPNNPIWYLLGLPMTGYLTYEYLCTTFREFWASSSSRWTKWTFWIMVMLAVWRMAALKQFAYYYMVPCLVILPVTRFWAEVSEHLGLDLRADFGSSRTNIGYSHMWYMNPHNDGYHAVHHLCSQVPFYLLPEAHQRLMEMNSAFATTAEISRGMFETFNQVAARKTVFKKTTTST